MNIAIDPSRAAPAIDLAHVDSFMLGAMHVEPALRRIKSPDSEQTLEPKVMQVLVALAREPGAILSHDDLIRACWEEAIVGDGSVNRVISLLRKSLSEVTTDSVRIETLPKVGYRLHIAQDRFNSPDAEGATRPSPGMPLRDHLRAITILFITAILSIGILVSAYKPASDPVEQTIAVLPAEWNGDPEPFLAAGVEAELRDHFARSEGIVVTGLETTQGLSLAGIGPRTIGERLGADFVLMNKFDRNGETIRVHSRLLPVESSDVLWQGQISSRIDASAALPARLAREVLLAVGRDPISPDKTEIDDELDRRTYLIAYGMVQSRSQNEIASARLLLKELRASYPKAAKVFSLSAKALALTQYSDRKTWLEEREQAHVYAKKAMEIDPDSVEALKIAALLEDDPAARRRMLETAVRKAPTDAEAWLFLSNERAALVDSRSEIDAMQRVALLDPLWNRAWQMSAGLAMYGLSAEADAIDNSIIAAAGAGWQMKMAQARMLERRGRLAEAWHILREIEPDVSEGAEILFRNQSGRLNMMLGLDPFEGSAPWSDRPLDKWLTGRMPGRQALRQSDVAGASFWDLGPSLKAAAATMVREGRSAELAEYYHMAFDSIDEFQQHRSEGLWVPSDRLLVSLYLGYAFRQAEHYSEADRMLEFARKTMERRMSSAGPKSVLDLIGAAGFHSMMEDPERSLDLLRQARAQGWPHAASFSYDLLVGPLQDDPIFDNAMDHPGFASLINEIETELRTQRKLVAERRAAIVSDGFENLGQDGFPAQTNAISGLRRKAPFGNATDHRYGLFGRPTPRLSYASSGLAG